MSRYIIAAVTPRIWFGRFCTKTKIGSWVATQALGPSHFASVAELSPDCPVYVTRIDAEPKLLLELDTTVNVVPA